MHSSTIYFGSTGSNFREVTNHLGDVAAGLAVYQHADGSIDSTAASGVLIGISLGKSLSDTSRTAVCRRGVKVPIKLESGWTSPAIGVAVQISTTNGQAKASGTAVNAMYSGEKVSALEEDGSAWAPGGAYIDFPGGL